MAILGLTDRGGQLPTIGDLRKGAKKEGNQPGRELTYWRFTSDDETAVAKFVEAVGEKPTSISVYLPFNDIDENFDAWMEKWGKSGLEHRCDGQTTVVIRDANGNFTREPQACPGGCKRAGRLKVIIPALERLAFITVHTSSLFDILNITQNLRALTAMNGGDLVSIPLILRRVPKEISVPNPKEPGTRMRVKKHLIMIEAAPWWVELQLNKIKAAQLAGSTAPQGQLPPGPDGLDEDDDDDDEGLGVGAIDAIEILDGDGGKQRHQSSEMRDVDPDEIIFKQHEFLNGRLREEYLKREGATVDGWAELFTNTVKKQTLEKKAAVLTKWEAENAQAATAAAKQ